MTPAEYTWEHRRGRDRDGDLFVVELLLHGSGRILARILQPVTTDEFWFRVVFYCDVPKKVLARPDDYYDFIDLDSAKRWTEYIFSRFDPLAPSEPEPARKETAAAAEKSNTPT